jgi:hypothetical protein
MNVKIERDKAMKHAYAFAKSGNFTWAQLWIDRAGHFLSPTSRQIAYAQRLYDEAKDVDRSIQSGI